MPINPGDSGATGWANAIAASISALFAANAAAKNLTAVTAPSLIDQAGDIVSQYGTNETGQRWDVRVGTAANPTAGGGPSVKIAQTEKVTNLATQMGGNPGANEHNAALSVAALGLTGSLAQTNAIMAIANGAPTGTDVCALGASGRLTGGTGVGFGAYLQGRRDTSAGHAVGAEIRVQNESGVAGTLNTVGMSDTVGVWVTSGATGGYSNGAGVAVGSADASSRFLTGFHATQGSVVNEGFRDDSASSASFRSVGTHALGLDLAQGTFTSYAIQLPVTTTSAGGISFGNDVFIYRSAAGVARVAGALSVSGAIKSDVDAGWVAPTLGNSWVNYGGAETTAAYRRMSDGTVRLRGSIKSGTTGTAIFTLPAGYRPAVSSREVFMAIGGPGVCEIDVGADGTVKVAQYIASGSNTFVSLSGISFTTD